VGALRDSRPESRGRPRQPSASKLRIGPSLLDAIEQAVIVLDDAGHVVYWSAFAERLYGWSAAEAVGINLADLIIPEETQSWWGAVIGHLSSGASWSGDVTVHRRNGTTLVVQLAYSTVCDHVGRVLGGVAVSFDVTERRRIDDIRRRLADVVTFCSDAIITTDLDGRVLDWNAGAERLYGYTAEEVVGRSLGPLVPPGRAAEVQSIVERLRRGERIDGYATQRLHKDGRLLDVTVVSFALRDSAGRVVAMAGITRDISALIDVQRRLRDSQERFLSLFSHHPDAIYALDLDGRYRALNPACEHLSGFAPKELLGKPFGERATPPHVHKRALAKALSGTPVTFENAFLHRDGHPVPVQITLVPTVVDGTVVGAYGVSKDVAEKKRTHEALATHARQQAAVADLGLWALIDKPLAELFNTAVGVIANMLDVELAALFEVEREGARFSRRAAVGWPEQTRDQLTFRNDPSQVLGFALAHHEAVTVADVQTDTRFAVSPIVPECARSGLVTFVPGRSRHNGVLLAFSTQIRLFSADDVSFLQAIANVLGAAMDRWQAEDELHRRDHEFKVLVENARDNIVRFDDGLRFMYVNPAAERMIGMPASKIIGRTNAEVAAATGGAADSLVLTWERALRRAFRSGEEEVLELSLPTHEGERFFEVLLSPEFGSDGAVNSVLGVGRDITANKVRDAERVELYRELLARDTRLHELVERLLLSQGEPTKRRGKHISAGEQFAEREQKLLRLVARGLTNREIGREMNLTAGTVKNYVASLIARLNAADRTNAVVRAIQLGLLSVDEDAGAARVP
jgi:PAS domain S-box-containing protein